MNNIMNLCQLSLEEDLMLPALASPVFPSQGKQQEKAKRRRKRRKKMDGEIKRKILSEEQAKFLEMSFERERRLGAARKEQLAMEAGIEPKRVAVWFQNRRARWKSKTMEEEFSKLKDDHLATLRQNRQLESEILKLRDELSEAQREIKKLSSSDHEGSFGNGGGSFGNGGGSDRLLSTTPPFFVEINQPHILVDAQQDKDDKYEFQYMNDCFGCENLWDWEMHLNPSYF